MNRISPDSSQKSTQIEAPPRLIAPFAVIALVIFASIVATFLMGMAVIRGHEDLAKSQNDIVRLKTVVQTVIEAETGQRGYLLTGSEEYLAPYTAAKRRISHELEAVEGFDDARLHEVTILVDLKLAELAETIALYRSKGAAYAQDVVKSNRGQNYMTALQTLQEGMVLEATQKMLRRQEALDRLGNSRTGLFALCGGMNLLFLGWAYKRIASEIRRSRMLAADYLKQKEMLAVALTSIGDGVIMTDQQGKVTVLNTIAQDLTGWSSSEAVGRDCSEVFQIINEDSRKAVESPVDKVLKTGLIVGLANHTLLIRKDGTELSIDDSGAPIRDDHGHVYGVVLVFRDFSEHRRTETILREAKEAAETASIAKDNFLATLSHELRTPLTPVVATLANWEADRDLSPMMQADIQVMRRNVELEARLIDDLLDLTRIVKGKLPLNCEIADVHELLSAVGDICRSDIRGKKLNFTMQLDAAKHFAMVDPGRIQQVFWNILKNATKFTAEEGRISIVTENCGASIRVTFADEGIGMSQETLGRLFRPFEQGAEENVRRYGGLGLGMAISKALIEAQQGSISAKSEGPGRGSQFTVELPFSDTPQLRTSAQNLRPQKTRELEILLVEDHQDTAHALARFLAVSGHQVTTAETVAKAKSALAARSFDLLLCDVGLPDETGIDLVRHLRTFSSMPAVALTGFGMESDVKDCLEAGFSNHLTKPLNLQRLMEVISSLTEGRRVQG